MKPVQRNRECQPLRADPKPKRLDSSVRSKLEWEQVQLSNRCIIRTMCNAVTVSMHIASCLQRQRESLWLQIHSMEIEGMFRREEACLPKTVRF